MYSLGNVERNGPKVFFKSKTTVVVPIAVVLATEAVKRYEYPCPIVKSRFIEKTTSEAVRASPLWNVTPDLKLNVYVVPFGDTVQLVARSGCSAPLEVGYTRVS